MKITITPVEQPKVSIKYPRLLKCSNMYAIATSATEGLQIDGENLTLHGDTEENSESWESVGFLPTKDKITFN